MKPIDVSQLKSIIVGMDTHQGETGKNNEDSCDFAAYQISDRNPTKVYLGIVADGIGGHQAGERASRLGVEVIKQHMLQANTPRLQHHMEKALLSANAAVVKEGQKDRKLRGMGTTMTAAAIVDKRLYVAHVGDSRAYLIRNGRIRQLSVDHTWAQEAIDAGRLSPEEARSHPNRNVIKRYMGIKKDMEVDFNLYHAENAGAPASERNQGMQLQNGDTILLCSDGLSDMITDSDILSSISKLPPQKAAEELVLKARKAGGFDNISVVVMQLPGKKKAAGGGGLLKFIPIIGGVIALSLVAVGLVWAFAAGPLKSRTTPTPVPTLEQATESPAEVATTAALSPTPSPTPAATETLPPSRTPSPTPEATQEEGGPATPTRLPTFTPTNTPLPTPTRTPTLKPTETNTPVPDTGGDGGGGKDKDKDKPPDSR